MFLIAGHTMGTPEYSLLDALRLFKRIGLDGAEIVVQDGYRCAIPEKASASELQELRETAEAEDIKIIALTPYYSRFNDLRKNIRQHEIDRVRRTMEYATFLGAKYIRIYGGNLPQGEKDGDGRKRDSLIESMKLLGAEAQSSGVCLAVENHFNTMTVSAADSIAVSEEIDCPSVGILYDQANLSFTGNEPFEAALPIQFKKISYVHIKDFVFRNENTKFSSSSVSHPTEEERNVITRIVGEGIIPWQKILQQLKDRGYNGWLSLEYERRWHPDDIPDASVGMKKSADFLRACLSKLT